jgi:hypothetical protein
VLVLPYELLCADALAFAARICTFCDLETPNAISAQRANVAMSPFAAALKRPLNRLFVRDALNPGAPLAFAHANERIRALLAIVERRLPERARRAGQQKMQRVIADVTGDRYRESNARTAALTGVDLGSHGYSC